MVNLVRWLSQSHSVDSNLFLEMLESIAQSFWSKTETITDILTKVYTILTSLLMMIVIIQMCKDMIGKNFRKKEGLSINA